MALNSPAFTGPSGLKYCISSLSLVFCDFTMLECIPNSISHVQICELNHYGPLTVRDFDNECSVLS